MINSEFKVSPVNILTSTSSFSLPLPTLSMKVACACYLSSGPWGGLGCHYGPVLLLTSPLCFLIPMHVALASALVFVFPAVLLVTM